MESRLSGAVQELRRLQQPGDTDIRVSEGAAGGATRVLGYRRLSIRTLSAIASSHGFDASVCIHEGCPSVVVELVNRMVHSPNPVIANGPREFGEKAKETLEAKEVTIKHGGSCSTITFKSNKAASAHALSNILATSRVIDIWAFHDRLVVLFSGTPKHTSALTHLRENRPELFSPQHFRTIADKQVISKKMPRKAFKK